MVNNNKKTSEYYYRDVEDEESADALQNLGFAATTTFGGLGSFNSLKKHYIDQVKKADIIILPCNSKYSKEYSKAICNSFKKSCKSVGIIELPDLHENVDKLKESNADVDFMVD